MYGYGNKRYAAKSASSKRRRVEKGKYAVSQPKPALKQYIKSIVNSTQETKMYDFNTWGGVTSFSYGSGASVGAFFGTIGQGTAANQRIGNTIFARGIKVRIAIQPGDNTNYVRILLVQAKPGMAPNVSPGSTATFVQNVLSNTVSSTTQWIAPVDTDRWEVLYDKHEYLRFGPLDGSTSTTIPSKVMFVDFFRKINRTMKWDDTGQMNNDVYLICISDSAAVPNPGAIASMCRVYYKDA